MPVLVRSLFREIRAAGCCGISYANRMKSDKELIEMMYALLPDEEKSKILQLLVRKVVMHALPASKRRAEWSKQYDLVDNVEDEIRERFLFLRCGTFAEEWISLNGDWCDAEGCDIEEWLFPDGRLDSVAIPDSLVREAGRWLCFRMEEVLGVLDSYDLVPIEGFIQSFPEGDSYLSMEESCAEMLRLLRDKFVQGLVGDCVADCDGSSDPPDV